MVSSVLLNLGPCPPPDGLSTDIGCTRDFCSHYRVICHTVCSSHHWDSKNTIICPRVEFWQSSGGLDLQFGTPREYLSRKLTLLKLPQERGWAGTCRHNLLLCTEWHHVCHRKPPNPRQPSPPAKSLQGRPLERRQ